MKHPLPATTRSTRQVPITLLATPTPTSEPTPHATACPRLGAVLRRVALSLLIACIIPATLFYTTFALAGVWTAIGVALVWSYGTLAWRGLTGRRTSGLLILTALLLTGRTIIALATDSPFVYFLQPIISDALVATLFLGSLATARPMVARLAGDFYPMDADLASRPRLQRLFRHLTLLWALLGLGKATLTLWLLQTQSMQTFVLAKSVSVLSINMLAAALTIGAAVLVARREGLMGPPAPHAARVLPA